MTRWYYNNNMAYPIRPDLQPACKLTTMITIICHHRVHRIAVTRPIGEHTISLYDGVGARKWRFFYRQTRYHIWFYSRESIRIRTLVFAVGKQLFRVDKYITILYTPWWCADRKNICRPTDRMGATQCSLRLPTIIILYIYIWYRCIVLYQLYACMYIKWLHYAHNIHSYIHLYDIRVYIVGPRERPSSFVMFFNYTHPSFFGVRK